MSVCITYILTSKYYLSVKKKKTKVVLGEADYSEWKQAKPRIYPEDLISESQCMLKNDGDINMLEKPVYIPLKSENTYLHSGSEILNV